MGRYPLAAANHTALFPFYINTTYIHSMPGQEHNDLCMCVGMGDGDTQMYIIIQNNRMYNNNIGECRTVVMPVK